MKGVMLMGLALICGCFHTIFEVNGEASFLNCGSANTWVPGQGNNFSPHPSPYVAGSATSCSISISPNVAQYQPGQPFTVTFRAAARSGFKIEANAGAFSGLASTSASLEGKLCVNVNKASLTTSTAVFTAPQSGTVTIKALCSASRNSPMTVANTITMTQLVVPTNAPTPPTTQGPTKPGETRSPTLAPTDAATFANIPPGGSTDPAFTFMMAAGVSSNIFYKLNDTHVRVKLEQVGTPGYLGLGVGTVEIGSSAVVGMDPTVNSPQPAVGLYKLVSKTGTKVSDIMTNVATTAQQLAAFGISETSFTTVSGTSTLKFSVELAKQQADFTLVKADASNVDIIFAGGPAAANGAFCKGGVCFAPDAGAFGALPGVNFALAPGAATAAGFAIPLDTNLMIHIITMLVGWGILIPLGVVIPLFNNIKYSTNGTAFCGVSGPMWLKYHWVLISIGLILTYVGTATGIIYVGGTDHFDGGTHQALGLPLLLITIIQPLAFLRPDKKAEGTIKQIGRKMFDYTHLLFGYVFTFLAIFENILGMELFNDEQEGLQYDFGGIIGDPGFGGPMGIAVLIISIVFLTFLVIGLGRAAYAKFHGAGGDSYQNMDDQVGDMRKPKRVVTLDELAQHNTAQSYWVSYNGKVYDCTAFLNSHPGGKKVMMPYAGKDMTKAYDDTGHSAEATAMLPKYYVGDMSKGRNSRSLSQRISQKFNDFRSYVNTNMPDGFNGQRLSQAMSRFSSIPEGWGGRGGGAMSSAMVAGGMMDMGNKFLSGGNQQRKKCILAERYQISHNTYYLKFTFPNPQMVLGLATGKHIAIYAPNLPGKSRGKWNGQPDPEADKKEISRKFTPVSCDEMDVGYFALVVKVYRPCKQYPDGGKISRYLETVRVGSQIEIAGPFGSHEYIGRGRFNDGGNELLFNEVAMVAGGSGITPVLQIASAMLRDRNDQTRIAMIFANSTTDDILMKDHLDELQRRYPQRFHIWYTVSQDPMQSGGHYGYAQPWPYSLGRLTKQMMREHLPPGTRNSVAVTCGPKPMMETANRLLREMGYPEERIVEY